MYEIKEDGIYEISRNKVDLMDFLKKQATAVLDAKAEINSLQEEVEKIQADFAGKISSHKNQIENIRQYLADIEVLLTDDVLEQISANPDMTNLLTSAFPEVFGE